MNNYVKGKSVAFVAMGTTIEGKGLGKVIDSFDVVIRTNIFPIPEQYQNDYGTRCNIISMLKTSAIKPEMFSERGIKFVIHYSFMEESRKSPLLGYYHMTIKRRNDIKKDIIRLIAQNPGHGTSGINIINTVLKCGAKSLTCFGMSGFQDKQGNLLEHNEAKHYIGLIDVKKARYPIRRHPAHKFAVQNNYVRYLLKNKLITMDQHSLEYFQ